MKEIKVLNLIVPFVLFVIIIGCGEDTSSSDGEGNKSPIVNAGKDISVVLNQEVTLTGIVTDDSPISSYEWKKGDNTLGTELSLPYTPTKIGVDTLVLIAVDNEGKSGRDEVKVIVKEKSTIDLPTVSKVMYKTDSELIKNSVHNLSFAYYEDKGSQRWYISPVDFYNQVDVYSLMVFKNGRNGWGTVGKNVASFNLNNEMVSIEDIEDNHNHTYYDRGWGESNTDPIIQSDIEKIRNSTVSIKWWFFQVSNGSWYIINKNGDTYKFSSKTKNGVLDYDWIKIDMGGAKPDFFIEDGIKKMRFVFKGIISTYYNSSSRIVYVMASSNVSNPKVYFAGQNGITGNCLGENSKVYMMDFQALTDVNSNIKANLEAGAKARGINVNLGVGGSSSSSYQTPAIYFYDFDSLVTTQLHYNIVAEQSGKIVSTGWLPDNGGGCLYTPNPLK